MFLCSYILPVRSEHPPTAELTAYLARIAARAELIVVDGSVPSVFASNAEAWSRFAIHCPVDSDIPGVNGKVRGVLTGLRRASHETIIIADDDVRYDDAALDAVADRLGNAHLVRPQNYFDPLPWHALWDTGRILLNRATDGDWPGTLGVRRSALRATNGYDANVLFENFELVRTVAAAGGRVTRADDIFVRRLPPTTPHFSAQRVRQAYDELARPARLLVELSLLPIAAAAVSAGGSVAAVGAVAVVVAIAEFGRRRRNGPQVFPASASLFAPLWLGERAVTIWIALWYRTRGGVRYAGRRVREAATPARTLRQRYAGKLTSMSIGLNDPLFDSSAEQAVTPTMRSISALNVR